MTIEANPRWQRFLPAFWRDSASTCQHSDNTVVITGAGGSIGSALARSIVTGNPRKVILLDSSEQNLAAVAADLPEDCCEAVLGSVEDRILVADLFSRHRPSVVYHAAAFKQVPFLEQNPFAAVRTNAFGTLVLARAALQFGVNALVLVSTDKAVRPHSVMGASKRLAESIVTSHSRPHCPMSAVRLANVIGSSGSVVPLFLGQIERGGPVTVTDPNAERWFLSMTEAVDALLTAGRANLDGRILVPEFGESVNIAKLAEFLIEVSGRDVKIRFTGTRPGDKLHEDRDAPDEVEEPPFEDLRVFRAPVLEDVLEALDCACSRRDVPALLELLIRAIPDYVPSEVLGGPHMMGAEV